MSENLIPAGYLSRDEALKVGGLSKATLERLVRAHNVESQLIPRAGKKHERVYKTADIERLREEKERRDAVKSPSALERRPTAEVPPEWLRELLLGLKQARQLPAPEEPKALEVPLNQKLWLSLDEARAFSGLTKKDLMDLIHDDHLTYRPITRKRGVPLRILRKSLEDFEG